MKAFALAIPLPPIERLGRDRADTLHVATSNTESHLNITLEHDRISLQPHEAIQLRDAISMAYPAPTFSTITKGDTVTVELTVTKVDRRSCGTTMFSTDAPEWFEAHDAIGYKAEPARTPIAAGQVRRFQHGHDYRVLATPEGDDLVVCCRYAGKGLSSPVLLNRSEVEAAMVITP